ncbi:MAG: Crp/Fnr family transcriptional regulator [Chitinophagaceae bacterium]|nr:Crp/Fnr family transcriptional regulator [Chitinophagaceae bacterium]
MTNHFEIFNRFIRSYVEMSDAELADFNQKCEVVSFFKGDIIMKAGEAQQNLYFITKGIVKNYIETDFGETKIYNFRLENMTVTGYAHYNYKDNLKSLVNVQCIEDSVMIQVPLKVIYYVVNYIKNGERLGRFLAEAHIIEMLNYIINRDSKSIIERYDLLEIEYPNIHQRVPQRMIASYLCITPVHLSNLKKSRKISIQ